MMQAMRFKNIAINLACSGYGNSDYWMNLKPGIQKITYKLDIEGVI
jgi:hypothetical protein